MSLNKVIIVGNLGADPEVRTSQNGNAVAKLRVATSSRVKKGDNWEDVTEWHRVVVFGKQAESCGKYLSKGRTVAIDGELRTSKYTDKENIARYSTEIVARDVKFLGGGDKNTSSGGGRGSAGDRHSEDHGGDFGSDEDIPF